MNLKKKDRKNKLLRKNYIQISYGVLKNELFGGLKSKFSINFPIDVEHV